ncbi:MAG TPA: LCP family protein [Actinomycetota bacterium]|nr:LCP family protein [Actinomycetota bacterium]
MHKRAVLAVGLLVVVLLATASILISRRNPPAPPPDNPPEPVTRTLLVQLRDPDLLALGSVLVGLDEQRLSQLWWTPEWWIDQLGRQEVSAADLGRKPIQYSMQTVQDQTGVRVDDAWVLDRLAFAGLVDAVGGVRVDVPQATSYVTYAGDRAVLTAGIQLLTGAQAVDYVLDSSLRDESVRLRRFQAVWDQVLRRFPTDPEKARTLLVSLGTLSKATMPSEELSALLSGARDLRVSGDSAQVRIRLDEANTVRVRPPQGVRRAYALDAPATARRLEPVFGAFPAPDDPVARVLAVAVRSKTVETLRAQLLARGWQTVWAGRARVPATTATVAPEVTEVEVKGLEQALGLTPEVAAQPLGQAQVAVAADEQLPVGL